MLWTQCGSQILEVNYGFTHVKFFGYKVQDGKWCLDYDRKQVVTDTPMPTDLKKMQRCLGAGIFFSEFIPDNQPSHTNCIT